MDRSAVAETHVSTVVFVGDRAYKLHKPVTFDFLDLSDRRERRRVCEREVELNRRLSPDVYLRVLDVVDHDGTPLDHLVEMRRMPSDRRLSTLLPADACLRAVARVMAAFHARADRGSAISAAGEPATVEGRWIANDAVLRRFTGVHVDEPTVDEIASAASRYLAGRAPLLERRIAEGRIVDGHGDLIADDIFCLDDGPRILDCLQFDDSLRWGDALADVAFLAMDLERLGHAAAARRFLDRYAEFSGETHPASLADHYVAYRAHIRAKVACLRAEHGGADTGEQAQALLSLAADHLRAGRVRLVLVGGLPGTGKSTVAAGLSARHGWSLLRSDEIRKDLAGIGHTVRPRAGYAGGIYAPAHTERTYATLLDRAERLLRLGETVVCDASWMSARHRDAARRLADESYADLLELRCVLDPRIAASRIRERERAGLDASDATVDVRTAMMDDMEGWPTSAAIDTSGTPEVTVDAAARAAR